MGQGWGFSRFLILIVLIFSWSAWAEPPSRADMDRWLRTMGFRDFSGEIAQERDRQERQVGDGDRKQVGLSPVAKDVMNFSIKRYQAINDARDLSTWVYERTKDKTDSPKTRDAVAELVARTLLLQPQELPDQWPAYVKTEADRKTFASQYIAKQVINVANRVTNDFMTTAYGADEVAEILKRPGSAPHTAFLKELAEVRAKVLSYVTLMQLDGEIGQSGYLGDALALGFTRASRLKAGKNGPLEKAMRERAEKYGANLDNSISNEPVFKDSKGKPQKIVVRNGSFVYEYSGGREAAEIAWAGRPSLWGTVKASVKGWLGSALARFTQPAEGQPIDETTYLGRIRKWLTDRGFTNKGVSHVGQAYVNEDAETGLAHVEIRDLYPDAMFGGERIITMRNFALAGPFRRLVVTTHDPKKLAAEFVRQVEEMKNPKSQWRSQVTRYDEKNEEVKPTGREKNWPVLFENSDLDKWVELAKRDPEAFAKLYAERSKQGWEFFLKEGVHFDAGFTDFLGAGYCAKGCVLASKLTMGLDVEPRQSRLVFPLSLLARLGYPGLDDLPVDRRFISPVSLAVQPMTGEVQQVEYPAMTDRERELARTEPFVPPSDPRMRAMLDLIPWHLENSTGDTYLADLMATIDEHVENYRLAADKRGPSKVMRGTYAARARAGKGPDTEHDGSEPKKEAKYPKGIAAKSLAVVESEKDGQPSKGRVDLDRFLRRMGLDDYAAGMRRTLERKEYANELARRTLVDNVERYEMVNLARDLATHILSRAEPNLGSARFRERFLPYAADLLNLKPEVAVKEVPWVVRNHPDLLQRADAIEKYFETAELHQGRMQLERLVSNYLHAMYGEEFLTTYLGNGPKPADYDTVRKALGRDIGRASDLFAKYLYKIHLDPHIGTTQWLGRGVALGLMRRAKLKKDAGLEEQFKLQVEARNLHLENFTSSELRMKNDKGEVTVIPVETGSLAYGRGTAAESATITSAALPHDRWGAMKEGLAGNLLGWFVPVEGHSVTNGLSPIERLRMGLAQVNLGNPGFSHVGQVIVYRDPETGLASTLIADNYPYPDESKLAGVRFTGFEHFGNENHYGWVGIAHLDPVELHKYAQEMARRTTRENWDQVAWKAFKPTVDSDGKVVPDANPPRGDWMKRLTYDEFVALHSEKDPHKWMKAWQAKVAGGWVTMMNEGTYFSWVDNGAGFVETTTSEGKKEKVYTSGKYYEQGTYCSQGCTIASLMTTGLPLEEPGKEGRWALFIRLMQKVVPIPDARALNTTDRIVPPSNLAMQRWIRRDGPNGRRVIRVHYPVASIVDRLASEEVPQDVEHSLRTTALLRTNPEFNFVIGANAAGNQDPVERQNAIHASMERTALRAVATGGAGGVEDVLGIDPEKVAKLREERSAADKPATPVAEGCEKGMAQVGGKRR